MRGEADGLGDVDVKYVQPTRCPLYFCQGAPVLIPDGEDPFLNQDLVAIFIKLTEAYNVCRQLGDVVHACQLLMLPVLARE